MEKVGESLEIYIEGANTGPKNEHVPTNDLGKRINFKTLD